MTADELRGKLVDMGYVDVVLMADMDKVEVLARHQEALNPGEWSLHVTAKSWGSAFDKVVLQEVATHVELHQTDGTVTTHQLAKPNPVSKELTMAASMSVPPLTKEQVLDLLPGTEVVVIWSGGNGPCMYTVEYDPLVTYGTGAVAALSGEKERAYYDHEGRSLTGFVGQEHFHTRVWLLRTP